MFLVITVSSQNWREICVKVSQGSFLDPLLFSIFINGIPGILSHYRHLVYTDDLQIYLHCSPHDLETGIGKMNREVHGVIGWASRNSLSLNLRKTKSVLVGGTWFNNGIGLTKIPQVTCDGEIIPFVASAPNLQVIIGNQLNSKKHVLSVCSAVNTNLYRPKCKQ